MISTVERVSLTHRLAVLRMLNDTNVRPVCPLSFIRPISAAGGISLPFPPSPFQHLSIVLLCCVIHPDQLSLATSIRALTHALFALFALFALSKSCQIHIRHS
jgi:hypothetical protein